LEVGGFRVSHQMKSVIEGWCDRREREREREIPLPYLHLALAKPPLKSRAPA
jgi:hypothetical protein